MCIVMLDQEIIFQLAAQEVSHHVQAMAELLHFIGQSIGIVDNFDCSGIKCLSVSAPIYHEVGSLCIISI